jgi:hypothetical protein
MKNKEPDLDSLTEHFRKIFVTFEIFNLRLSPIEKIVYTAATAVGLAVVAGVMALVVKK